MPNTITTYNTFSGGTKARATQVNQNFSNYRGTLLPINEDSASASTNTHDLGSADHRWNDVYANTINLRGATSTSAFSVVPSTSSTAGSVNFMFGSTTACSFDPNGLVSAGATSTSGLSFAGSTVGGTTIAGSSLTIVTHGRPILISLQKISWLVQRSATTSAIDSTINLYADSVNVAQFRVFAQSDFATSGSLVARSQGSHHYIDMPAAGSHTYYLTISNGGNNTISLSNLDLVAVEL